MAPPYTKAAYHIGIICALAIEAAAVKAMLDEIHDELPQDAADINDYTLGRIGAHNVVVACLPAGVMGNHPATTVAENMKRSFSIKFGLMVGVGGGVPSSKFDIRLGDVVVSQPTGAHGGVVQWDYGKTEVGGFRHTGTLNRPPEALLHALQSLKIHDEMDGIGLEGLVSLMVQKKPNMAEKYEHQGLENDQLFLSTYDHSGGETCDDCDKKQIVKPNDRKSTVPAVYYGNIASGNQVMKHGATRDEIAKQHDVICFEMEAAGLMDNFPCLVIRGICDYADSHKNKRWQCYAAATAAAFARVLLGFVKGQEIIDTTIPHRVLPFGRNISFVGRQSYLDRLVKIFHTDHTGESCPRAALSGLGGIGKTQIALEFAFQLQKESPGHSVFWVRATDVMSFEKSYLSIGAALRIPGLGNPDADVKALVQSRLASKETGKWVIVVDNADDSDLIYETNNTTARPLNEYLPYSPLGGIVFTTRDREAAVNYADPVSNIVDIKEMSTSESKELLEKSLKNNELLEEEETIKELLELLINLPLAIMQAAAYLNSKQTTVARYVQMFRESDTDVIELLSKEFDDNRRYSKKQNPVAITWLISFAQIERQDQLAADYMRFISCIKEQSIPEDILPDISSVKGTDALGTLQAFGFLNKQIGGRLYSMHRLVHLATRNWLKNEKNNEKGLSTWACKVLQRMLSIIPYGGHKERETWMAYLPHGMQVVVSADLLETMEEEKMQLLNRIGHCQASIEEYKAAGYSFQRVLEFREEKLGRKHPSTLTSMNNLAGSLSDQGDYTEAEAIYRQTLILRENVLGKEHPNTLTTTNNLANVLKSQGKYTDAEAMYRQILVLSKEMLGKEHPDTLTSMSNLAQTLNSQGKYTEAEIIHQEELVLSERVLGKEHPDTITSMDNLAQVLSCQGKYAEAETIHQKELVLSEKVLGKEHPDTLTSVSNLANVLSNQGKYTEAEAMLRQTLLLREKVLGKEHPDTLTTTNNLANVLSNQGKYTEAEAMHQWILALREKVLGEEHPDTLTNISDLANALSNQGKYSKAEAMLRQTLVLREKVLGKEHPDTLTNINDLANALSNQGKYTEAEAMHRQTLVLGEKVLGKEHPYTLTITNNLANVLSNQGKYTEAEAMHRQTLALREKVLGRNHPRTLQSMRSLQFVIQQREAEAENTGQGFHRPAENVSNTESPIAPKTFRNQREDHSDDDTPTDTTGSSKRCRKRLRTK